MRSGQVLAIGIVIATLLFGVAVWYTQTRAWYVQFVDVPVTAMRFDGTVEPLQVTDFQGIDADTSPLRYRGCFTVGMSIPALTETYLPYDAPTPLNAPGWFGCFDAEAIGLALEEGRAFAFLSVFNEPYGFDRVIAVMENGRGYIWSQSNPCGEAAYSGDELPPQCPPAP